MKSRKRVIFAATQPPVLTDTVRSAQLKQHAANPGIPVLTDIVPTAGRKLAPVKKPETAPATLDVMPWDELEERLTGRIRTQVMERLDFVLDDNISQHVSSVLEKVAVMLAEEIKHDMQNTLEVIVTSAITTELQRLQQKEARKKNNTSLPGK